MQNADLNQPAVDPVVATIEPMESVALAAYRDLMTGPVPANEAHFRRCIMLAVLIGRQIEADQSA